MADQVTIKNGTVTADTVNVDVQLNANTVSVNGDVTVTGNVSLNGKDIIETIQEQKAELQEHATNMGLVTSPHLSAAEHEKLAQVISLFENYSTDTSIPVINAPTAAGAIDLKYFPGYFSLNAMENWDLTVAPGHVFVSRVPYASYDAETNTSSFRFNSIADAGNAYAEYNTFGDTIKAKLLDNESRQHKCSTDTVEEVDDYVGKEWAFFWEYGNYIKDSSGNKHLTSIRGTTIDTNGNITGTNIKASPFDIKKNTAAFGPVFWFFCKPEKWQDPNSGEWFTSDKTENGEPIAQLWGISDSPWSDIDANHPMYNDKVYPGLSADKRAKLEALGITEEDFHIWPECLIASESNPDIKKIRPYWIHSAFCGGYVQEIMEANPTTACVSICNAPLRTNVSYQSANDPSDNGNATSYPAANVAGSACVNGFGMLFDIIKNATKNSQAIHTGLASGAGTKAIAPYSITAAQQAALKDTYDGYIFPIPDDKVNAFQIGRTVRIECDVTSTTGANNVYTITYDRQIGRVKAILNKTLSFTTKSGVAVTNVSGLVIDPAEDTVCPISPFEVVGEDEYPAVVLDNGTISHVPVGEAASALAATEVFAACAAIVTVASGGETLNGGANGTGVIGKHDGSVVDVEDDKHPYRVQGTEYMPGAWIVSSDTVSFLGQNTTIDFNGESITVDSTKYIVIACPPGKPHLNKASGANSTVTDWLNNGYEVVGLMPSVRSGSNIDRVYNTQLTEQGIAHPVLLGSVLTDGHADQVFLQQTAIPFATGGNLTMGGQGGSAAVSAISGSLSLSYWFIATRD